MVIVTVIYYQHDSCDFRMRNDTMNDIRYIDDTIDDALLGWEA